MHTSNLTENRTTKKSSFCSDSACIIDFLFLPMKCLHRRRRRRHHQKDPSDEKQEKQVAFGACRHSSRLPSEIQAKTGLTVKDILTG